MRYRKQGIQLNTAPTEIEPTPMTREGTRSLVERHHALRRMVSPTQVGVGVYPGWVRATSLASLPSTKPKRTHDKPDFWKLLREKNEIVE